MPDVLRGLVQQRLASARILVHLPVRRRLCEGTGRGDVNLRLSGELSRQSRTLCVGRRSRPGCHGKVTRSCLGDTMPRGAGPSALRKRRPRRLLRRRRRWAAAAPETAVFASRFSQQVGGCWPNKRGFWGFWGSPTRLSTYLSPILTLKKRRILAPQTCVQ